MEFEPLIKRKTSVIRIVKNLIEKKKYLENRLFSPIRIPETGKQSKNYFHRYTPAQTSKTSIDPYSLRIEELIEIIRNQKICGKGGGAFSTAEKIERLLASKTESLTLIINAVECDPGLRHDKWIMENHSKAIEGAAQLLSEKLNLHKVILAAKETKGETFSAAGITTEYIPDYYPAGEERNLIKMILDLEVPQGSYPANHGILILNVQTMYRIYAVLMKGVKNPGHFLTLTNMKKNSVHIIHAEEGHSVFSIVDDLYPGEKDIFAGGGIMQSQKASTKTLVDDRITSITISAPQKYTSNKCLECMQCVIHCPAGLDVRQIAETTRKGDFSKSENLAIDSGKCISCGTCNYVCPAGLNLIKLCRDYSEKRQSSANAAS